MFIRRNYITSKHWFLCLLFALTHSVIFANATVRQVDAFQPVIAQVEQWQKQYGTDQVLIVLDIDNTILTSSVDLGGDIWYQWQRGKLDIKPTDEQQVKCLFKDSIGLLYELGTMNLTEQHLPKIISTWQEQGLSLMALTSRAPKYRAATERELYNKGIQLNWTALAPDGEPTPVYREKVGRELSYMQGIMMTSGLHKGEMLDWILKKTGRSFKAIVFVDDSEKNIKAVHETFQNQNTTNIQIFHYQRIESQRIEKYGTVLTQKQADQMADDWELLNLMLNKLFPQRDTGEACLSKN